MNSLFPEVSVFPPGFVYIPDFLSTTEESELHQAISKLELHTFLFQGYEAKRKVASFGYDYSFDKRTLSKGREILRFLWRNGKIAKFLSISEKDFAELLVTEYPVGSLSLAPRCPPFELIAGLSLLTIALSVYVLTINETSRKSIISFPVRRRSLYVMQGPSRSEWQHSTSPVKAVRYPYAAHLKRNLQLFAP